MLPVELIDDNGIMLKKCVMQLIELWGLGDEFKKWVDEACVFTSTLVDRIITGYPRATEKEEWEKLGYEDHIMVTGEPFALWVIESAKDISKEFLFPMQDFLLSSLTIRSLISREGSYPERCAYLFRTGFLPVRQRHRKTVHA